MQTTLSTNTSGASLALPIFLLGTTLSVIVGASRAADTKAPETANDATLKGLTAIRVAIDVSGTEVELPGLRKADLQSRIEGKMKKAGLQVLGESERAQGMPTLYLNLNLLALDQLAAEVYVFSIDLALIQEVRLLRAPGIKAASPTWRAPGSLGTIDAAELVSLRDTADELADRFLAAYRAANGR